MNKILIIENSLGFTGAFKSIFQVTSSLVSQFEFIYLIPKGSKNVVQLKKSPFKVIEFKFIEISRSYKTLLYLPWLIYNSVKIIKQLKKTPVDIVHVNDMYNMLGVMIKILTPKVKLVYHIRLLPNSYVKGLYSIWKNIIESYADEIICVSETVASNFSKERVKVIYDSIKTSHIEPVTSSKPTNDNLNILYLANYTPGKGHRQAIESLSKISLNINNAQLVFFGGTLNKAKNIRFKISLIQYSQKSGLADSVFFNGFSSFPEQEFAKADLMLNFSESESFSMTTLEALAHGIPIIATDCGGPSEIIENGLSGLLVPVNDIDAMSSAIKTLISDKSLRLSLSQNGQQRVNMKFKFEEQTSKLFNVYNRLLY